MLKTFITISGLVLSLTQNTYAQAPLLDITEQSNEAIVEHYANEFGVDTEIALRLVECESGFKQTAIGDSGKSRGVMQYQEATFERHNNLYNQSLNKSEDLDYNSAHDQIMLGMWAISEGYGNEWTAYRAIMNGGTYSFYSKQLGKSFTVTCR